MCISFHLRVPFGDGRQVIRRVNENRFRRPISLFTSLPLNFACSLSLFNHCECKMGEGTKRRCNVGHPATREASIKERLASSYEKRVLPLSHYSLRLTCSLTLARFPMTECILDSSLSRLVRQLLFGSSIPGHTAHSRLPMRVAQ